MPGLLPQWLCGICLFLVESKGRDVLFDTFTALAFRFLEMHDIAFALNLFPTSHSNNMSEEDAKSIRTFLHSDF